METTVISICLICLAIFNLIIALVAIFRLFRVMQSKTQVQISIGFYATMIVAVSTRAATFLLIALNDSDTSKTEPGISRFLMSYLFSLPDSLYICVYIFLVWYFFANFIMSHISVANDLSFFLEKDEPTFSILTYKLMLAIVIIYFLASVLLNFLIFFNVFSNDKHILFTSNSCIDIIIPTLAIGYYIFMLHKFSGRPYKSDKLHQQTRKILMVTSVWTLTRIILGILGLVQFKSFMDQIIDIYQNHSPLVISKIVWIVLYFVVSEFLPNLFSLDYTFMLSYLTKPQVEEKETLNGDQESIEDLESLNKHSQSSDGVFSYKKRKESLSSLFVKQKDLIVTDLIYKAKHGLGGVYMGKYKGDTVACRVIKFDRISRYELENFSKDFEDFLILEQAYLCPVLGICVENLPTIIIIYSYYKNKSLYDLLHVENHNISMQDRIELLKKIALGMRYLHSNHISHSHLSSKNVLIGDDLEPFITDYGLNCLKDNAAIFLDYHNKNAYTAPELLKEGKMISNSVEKQNYANDVYAFGILSWEVYMNMIPFNVKLKKLHELVVEGNYRPEITKGFNWNLSSLIRACWDADPMQRPDFNKILEILSKVKLS